MRRRWPRCPSTHKLAYPNAIEASAGALRSSRRSNRPMRVYQCQLCAAWHITSRPDRRVA